MTTEAFEALLFSLTGIEKKPHFDRVGYKVVGKRMIATYLAKNHTVNIFLSPEEQAAFCNLNASQIYPVPNKWGEKGATTFDLAGGDEAIIFAALESAYKKIMK